MKIHFVKAFTALLLILSCTINTFAADAVALADTSIKSLLADTETDEQAFLLCEANVKYPEEIEVHLENSLTYVEKFTEKNRAYLVRTFKASPTFIKKATAVFNKYEVPAAFCLLMALESGFKASARSHAGAVGYWQFMDEVAHEYGLRTATTKTIKKTIVRKGKKVVITRKITSPDDRMNFAKSTDAAARYLRDRLKNLDNDWLLVAASYNWGIGNVMNAMKRCGKDNPDFWDIKRYMPAETRSYVMNFITLSVISNNYENFLSGKLAFRNIYSEVLPAEGLGLKAPVFVD